jgi:hypothetical protein
MRMYYVRYDSLEGHNTAMFFGSKKDAKKWIRENKYSYDYVDDEPAPCFLKSTKKSDIITWVNIYTGKP